MEGYLAVAKPQRKSGGKVEVVAEPMFELIRQVEGGWWCLA